MNNKHATFQDVMKWATDRNFYGEGGATYEQQTLKFLEELGELCGAYVRKKDLRDHIGDCLVVHIILRGFSQREDETYSITDVQNTPNIRQSSAYMLRKLASLSSTGRGNEIIIADILGVIANAAGLTLQECLDVAYGEIKDRKGKFIDGVFVKESDLSCTSQPKS